MADVHILGIETSCDETAAAVVRAGEETKSNVVLSQFATHQVYGGVVPELASREHLRAIVPIVRQALKDGGQSYESIDAIAVTQGPGLAGALLVGVSYAKALSFALEKPLIAVNHLEGHIHAVLLEERQHGNREIKFPLLALIVSGGHTHLFLCQPLKAGAAGWSYKLVGRTRDDAAGEAYDKVAKLLGLGYPGGPIIDRLAKQGNPKAVSFTAAQIKHRDRSRHGDEREEEFFDFSFSGIKTAVLRYVEVHGMKASIEARRNTFAKVGQAKAEDVLLHCNKDTLDLIASFQHSVVEDLVAKTLNAAQAFQPATLFVTGGVAANSELRRRFEEEAPRRGLPVFFPSRPLSTDNAAMIAAAAYPKFLMKDFAPPEFSAEPSLQLQSA